MNSMNRKGAEKLFWIIIGAAVAIVVGILILVWFNTSGGKAFRSVDTQLDALGDYDDDRVANGFDKCPCTTVGSEEQAGLRGCPQGTTPEQARDNQQKFKDNKCSEITAAPTSEVLYLELSTSLTPDSYETTNNFLRYRFTCPASTSCNLRITSPDGRVESDIQPDAVNDWALDAKETYVFDLIGDDGESLKTITVTKK